jgi:hypothetical protein
MAVETEERDGLVMYHVVCDMCRTRLSTYPTEAMARQAMFGLTFNYCSNCRSDIQRIVQNSQNQAARPPSSGLQPLPQGAQPIYDRDPDLAEAAAIIFREASRMGMADSPSGTSDCTPVVVHVSDAQIAITNGTATMSQDGLTLQNLTNQTLLLGGVVVPRGGSVPLTGVISQRQDYQSVEAEPKPAWSRLGKDDFDFDD